MVTIKFFCRCIYLVVAIMKKVLNLQQSLYEILQIFSILVLQEVLITQVLMKDRQQNKMLTIMSNCHYLDL
jgi:hypothetical protein